MHAVARAEPSEQRAAVYVTAAFAGLRMGELRGLRWMDVDFGKRLVHVRRNSPPTRSARRNRSGFAASR